MTETGLLPAVVTPFHSEPYRRANQMSSGLLSWIFVLLLLLIVGCAAQPETVIEYAYGKRETLRNEPVHDTFPSFSP